MAMDFDQASDLFTRIALHMPEATDAMLERAAVMVEEEAKRVIGTYDYGWPHLSPDTIAAKGADTPLLETGELRDSIEHYVDHETKTAYVGSNNPKAEFHEFGTSRIPPRPFLSGAAMAKEPEIHVMVGEAHYAMLSGRIGQTTDLIGRITSLIYAGVDRL